MVIHKIDGLVRDYSNSNVNAVLHLTIAYMYSALFRTVSLCYVLLWIYHQGFVLHVYLIYPNTWWRNQMETLSALLALCAGNSPVPVNSPHKGQWRGALMFSLICARINDLVNNRKAGDLRRNRGHYDVNVMSIEASTSLPHCQGNNHMKHMGNTDRYNKAVTS